jgi:AcrR family transcriptional regulator
VGRGPVARPRDAAIDQAILLAAWTELNRSGYAALTMTTVATEAGVQKPALYRRWPTKPLLVIDTLALHLPELTAADHGSLEADLAHVLDQLAGAWSTPAARWSLSPLLADVAGDADALAALRERLLQPRGLALQAALARARDRGELRPDAPLDVIGDLLEGPLMHRATFGSGELDAALLDAIRRSCLALLATR